MWLHAELCVFRELMHKKLMTAGIPRVFPVLATPWREGSSVATDLLSNSCPTFHPINLH